MIPFDPRKPLDPSGLRIGTAALTTRGFGEEDMKTVADLIVKTLKNIGNEGDLNSIRASVKELTSVHPLYEVLQ